jgi:hypothetical protein
MSALLVKVKQMISFSTEIMWENIPPYCGQLPTLEKIEPAKC